MRSLFASVLLVAAFALSACSSGEASQATSESDTSPALLTACNHLKAGEWSALSEASHAPEVLEVSPVADALPRLPASGTLEDWFNNTGLFGNAYANDMPQQPRPLGWTDEDMKEEAARTFTTAWSTCARDIDGFPGEPDAELEQQVTEGALELAP